MSMTGSNIKCVSTGLIYRNSKPHVSSVQAYFPSVVLMANGELLATLVLGAAFESPDCRTNVARSIDNGKTWQLEGPIYVGTRERLTSDASRITSLPDGEIVAFMVRADRAAHPGEGLTNPENLGFVPAELLILRSNDFGHSWTEPQPLTPPLVGPSFELCSPITPLTDGRWLLPTHTWHGWDGHCPNGLKMVAFVSHDRGQTWPEYVDVMADPEQRLLYWESKIVEFQDGRLLAAAWAYDRVAAQDLPNQYAISHDGGATWSPPRSTGLQGQTLTPFLIDDERVLCMYRRMDEPGLWANLSHLENDEWVNDASEPLWGAQTAGLTGTSGNMSENFQVLRFGAPCIMRLPDGMLFVAFWCYEDCVSNIRWFKLQID
jgi:sialidase-1